MHIDELKLPAPVTERLREAGLDKVAAVLEAGTDGLQAIDGIGPKTASDVLAAARAAGNDNTTPADDVPEPDAAPDGNGDADPKVPLPAAEADPNSLVTVRNVSGTMVLVGERYLLPGQSRTVRRRLVRHIAPGTLEVR